MVTSVKTNNFVYHIHICLHFTYICTYLVTTTPKCLHSIPMNSIISITMIATANKMTLVALSSKPFVTNLAIIKQINMKTSINAKTDAK